MTAGILLAIAATVVYNLGFTVEKRALDRLPAIDIHQVGRLLRTLFTAPAWLLGFAAICCGLALQVVVLSLEPLTIAQPLQASGIVVTLLFAWLVLHERLGWAEFACIGVIAAAVALLSLSSISGGPGNQAGTSASGAAIALAACPVAVIVAVVYYESPAAPRHQRRQETGVGYGFGAGLVYGYAGLVLKALSAAVFARPHSRPGLAADVVAAITSPYLYVMLASAAVGMCLFQVGLQRGRASIVMPVSLVMSTGYPVLIGSWLFHERLPDSPGALAMRAAGGIAAVSVPVILAVASERRERRERRAHAPGTAPRDTAIRDTAFRDSTTREPGPRSTEIERGGAAPLPAPVTGRARAPRWR